MRLKLTFLRDNLLINDNVLEGSHQAKVQKLVSCLSTCVFPDKVEYPLDETKVHRAWHSCNIVSSPRNVEHRLTLHDSTQSARPTRATSVTRTASGWSTSRTSTSGRMHSASVEQLADLAPRSAYNDQFGSNFTSVIPTNIFGPGDNYTIGDAHVIPELMHKALLAKSASSPKPLCPDGSSLTSCPSLPLLQRPARPSPSLDRGRLCVNSSTAAT